MIFSNENKIKFIKLADKYIGGIIIYILYYLARGLYRKKYSVRTKIDCDTTKKYLLIKLFGIGNIFLILPSAKIIKEQDNDAIIDLLTISSNKGIVESTGLIRECFYIRDDSFLNCFKDIFRLTFKIRKENYDIVIDFEQFISLSSILTFFSKSKSTIGFNNPFSRRAVLYSEGVNYVEDRHMEDIFKTLLMPFLGDANKNTEVNFNFTRQESKVKEVLGKNNLRYGYDFIIVIHPGTSSNFEKRRWPTEKFEYLSNLLLENFDVKLVFTGKGIGESALIEGIINNLGSPSRAINSCNLFNLEEFIALIKLSNLVITNDTAPVQIAPALHIPCLALFGPNTPFLYGPRHERSKFIYKYLACSPCITNLNNKQSSCINAGCMNRISVEEVFKSVEPYCQEYRIIYGETQDKNFSKPKQVTV